MKKNSEQSNTRHYVYQHYCHIEKKGKRSLSINAILASVVVMKVVAP